MKSKTFSLFNINEDYEVHRGPLLNKNFGRDLDKKAIAFILAERHLREREQAEGEEAVRVALRDVQVHSVDHCPGQYDVLDEVAIAADETFHRLPEKEQYKLRLKLRGEAS